MEFLKKLKPESRKLIVLIVFVVLAILNAKLEIISGPTFWGLVGVVGAWLVGQGIADHGTQGAINAVRRAMERGDGSLEPVVTVLAGLEPTPTSDPQESHEGE